VAAWYQFTIKVSQPPQDNWDFPRSGKGNKYTKACLLVVVRLWSDLIQEMILWG